MYYLYSVITIIDDLKRRPSRTLELIKYYIKNFFFMFEIDLIYRDHVLQLIHEQKGKPNITVVPNMVYAYP